MANDPFRPASVPPPYGNRAPNVRADFDADEDEQQEHRNDDFDGNELHAGVGTTCAKCGRAIQDGEYVRRRIGGEYCHESC